MTKRTGKSSIVGWLKKKPRLEPQEARIVESAEEDETTTEDSSTNVTGLDASTSFQEETELVEQTEPPFIGKNLPFSEEEIEEELDKIRRRGLENELKRLWTKFRAKDGRELLTTERDELNLVRHVCIEKNVQIKIEKLICYVAKKLDIGVDQLRLKLIHRRQRTGLTRNMIENRGKSREELVVHNTAFVPDEPHAALAYAETKYAIKGRSERFKGCELDELNRVREVCLENGMGEDFKILCQQLADCIGIHLVVMEKKLIARRYMHNRIKTAVQSDLIDKKQEQAVALEAAKKKFLESEPFKLKYKDYVELIKLRQLCIDTCQRMVYHNFERQLAEHIELELKRFQYRVQFYRTADPKVEVNKDRYPYEADRIKAVLEKRRKEAEARNGNPKPPQNERRIQTKSEVSMDVSSDEGQTEISSSVQVKQEPCDGIHKRREGFRVKQEPVEMEDEIVRSAINLKSERGDDDDFDKENEEDSSDCRDPEERFQTMLADLKELRSSMTDSEIQFATKWLKAACYDPDLTEIELTSIYTSFVTSCSGDFSDAVADHKALLDRAYEKLAENCND